MINKKKNKQDESMDGSMDIKTYSTEIEGGPVEKVHMSNRVVLTAAKQIQGDQQPSNKVAPFTGAKPGGTKKQDTRATQS